MELSSLAKAITDAADRMRLEANHLDRLAQKLVDEKDLGYVNEAVSCIVNVPQAVQLSILVSRLVRQASHGIPDVLP